KGHPGAIASRPMRYTTDYLVLGSGIAGLTFALRAAEHGDVAIVTKRGRADSATNFAQGGISAVLDPADSFEAHVHDTLTTRAGLSKRDIVEITVRDAPDRVRDLIAIGTAFSKTREGHPSGFDLGREGGHSARRVIHAGDITGREVERALLQAAEANPRIRF